MAIKIKYEDAHGNVYTTPVIEDTDAIFKRPGVLTDDDDYDYNRKNFKAPNLTKKKSKKRNT